MSNTGQVDDQDRLLSYGSATYQYDNYGTLTNKADGGQATAYRYDARGSLLGVQYGTNEISYSVDALGRRILRTKNGVATHRFVYQGFLSPVAELNSDGSVATRFVYATRANVPDYMVQGGSTYRIITDIRGSVRLVVNADTRVIVQRLDYDEWGNVTQDSNPGFQPFGFAGGLYDPDTGLVRFGFRDYDPEVGRWIAKDPILFAGGQANLYLYCYGDPINWIDIYGMRADWNFFDPLELQYDESVGQMVRPYIFANNIPDKLYTVAGHGSGYLMRGPNKQDITPKRLSQMIRTDSSYKPGTPIYLYACLTGAKEDGFAQKLANLLNTEVWAPTDTASLWSTGKITVDNGGVFREFKPITGKY